MTVLDKFKDYIPEVMKSMEIAIPRDSKPKYVYDLIWDFLDRGGKRIRPILFMMSCKAVGGDPKEYMQVAAAIEFFHNFTLIHDDIEDDSKQRRGKPCTHIKYGLPLAINAGDGLFVYSLNTLINADMKPKKLVGVSRILSDGFVKVLEGQGYDIGWEKDKIWDITEEDYFKMVSGKTGSLIAVSCEAGAFLGGGKKRQVKALREFGMAIGIAFQIQDDILNITGGNGKFKKTLREDITEGKRTLMVIRTLSKCKPGEKKVLTETLDAHTTDPDRIEDVVRLFKKYKAIEYADKTAKRIVVKAKKKLERALPESEYKTLLLELADFITEREY